MMQIEKDSGLYTGIVSIPFIVGTGEEDLIAEKPNGTVLSIRLMKTVCKDIPDCRTTLYYIASSRPLSEAVNVQDEDEEMFNALIQAKMVKAKVGRTILNLINTGIIFMSSINVNNDIISKYDILLGV